MKFNLNNNTRMNEKMAMPSDIVRNFQSIPSDKYQSTNQLQRPSHSNTTKILKWHQIGIRYRAPLYVKAGHT